ncbi:hypothetical protein ANO14919_000410 [Xylariales sp. No.14919]|nr:hypothetical protein ANO14919_000410 [Xylariales sp. No.14919]
MSQQRDYQVRDTGTSSQLSREDDDICSNKATSGSSDSGSDDLGPSQTRSRSSERGLQRHATRRLAQHLQTARTSHSDIPDAARGESSLGSSSLIGLTLDPLPPDMVPNKKRSLGEVLGDDSPPQKDKLSAEIDRLAEEDLPNDLSAGSSGTQNVAPAEPHRHKRIRASGDPSTSRVVPIVPGGPSTSSDGPGNRPGEGRSERTRAASHRGNPATSD